MKILRTGTIALTAAILAASSLPMLEIVAKNAAADPGGALTLQVFEHDTQQTSLDLGTRGAGPGDQFIFAGDLFDHQGGTKLGHTAGQCTTLSGNATSGDTFCTQMFNLDGGQIAIQGMADTAALFVRGEPVPISIVGGTGIYSGARGDGTVQVPPDVPNQTDSTVILNVITG